MRRPRTSEDELRPAGAAASILRIAAALLAALAIAPGCSSPRDRAVPGCPVCGDPRTTIGADGRGVVLGRLRIRPDGAAAIHAAMGLAPWVLGRGDSGADATADPGGDAPGEPASPVPR